MPLEDAVRQRNPFPVPVDLMETKADDGTLYGPVEVEPGGVVAWPIEIGGFVPADDPAPEPAPDPAPEQPAPDSVEGQGAGAGPSSKHPRKPGRASASTDEEPAP